MSDRLEGQQQEQAIKHYLTQADELDRWLIRMRAAVISNTELKSPEVPDKEDQLAVCHVRAPPAVHSKQCMEMC